ncbi:MAG: AAA family ATPase, partial [Prevotella sp.]|nr:AAA family ATPase [Prevotella sp.]
MTEQSTLISEELTLAGEASPVTPEIIALNSHRITTETQLKDQEYLFRLQDKPCFPRCDVTTITGPAKSGKTFFVSMLMACCAERQVLALERVREEPLSVLWLDTEQSRQSTKDILAGRIARLVQTPFPDERFYVFNVRSATYKERREMMALAIETYRPDLVILDNISDLSFDINSGEESTGLMEQLMQLATNFECSIVSIIHLNR